MFNRLKIVVSVAKKSVQYGVNFVESVNTKAINVVGLGDKFSKVEIKYTLRNLFLLLLDHWGLEKVSLIRLTH
jgi:hypothetical protein